MTAYEKQSRWIIRWLLSHNTCDVTDRDFHDSFADEFKVRQVPRMIGANECPAAMRTISRMFHREHILSRSATGLDGLSGMGFPKWVYVYRLKGWAKELYGE